MVRVDEEVPHWESAAIRWRRCCGFSCRWSLILHAGTSDLSSFMFQHDDDPNTPSVKHTGDRHQSRTSAWLKQSGTTQHECPSGSPENWRSSETESSSELTLSWRMKLLAPQIHLQAACFCPVCCICIYIYSIQIFLQNIKNWGVAEDCCTALYAHTHTHGAETMTFVQQVIQTWCSDISVCFNVTQKCKIFTSEQPNQRSFLKRQRFCSLWVFGEWFQPSVLT